MHSAMSLRSQEGARLVGDPLDTSDVVARTRDGSVDMVESEPSGVATLCDDAAWLVVVIQSVW